MRVLALSTFGISSEPSPQMWLHSQSYRAEGISLKRQKIARTLLLNSKRGSVVICLGTVQSWHSSFTAHEHLRRRPWCSPCSKKSSVNLWDALFTTPVQLLQRLKETIQRLRNNTGLSTRPRECAIFLWKNVCRRDGPLGFMLNDILDKPVGPLRYSALPLQGLELRDQYMSRRKDAHADASCSCALAIWEDKIVSNDDASALTT